MPVQIPASRNTQDRIKMLLEIPSSTTSNYWESRKNDLNYEILPSTVRMTGMYDEPETPFAARRILGRINYPFGIKHKSYYYLNKHRTKTVQELSLYFHKYELAKSVYLHRNIQKYRHLVVSPYVLTEIGAGAGILGVLALVDGNAKKYIDIDLKEMIPHALATHSLFAGENEITINDAYGLNRINLFDISSLPEIKFNIGVNAVSFQEMDAGQVDGYMGYIQKNLEPGGLFFSLQRVEKYDPIRRLQFREREIPWPGNFKTLHLEEAVISRYNGRGLKLVLRVLQAK